MHATSGGAGVILILGAVFGVLASVVAFLGAYDGYSHFPAISRRKRVTMSLEYAAFAFVVIMGVAVLVSFLLSKGVL